MSSVSPTLRSSRIEPLGVSLPHGILDIMLMNVRPGFEKVVIDSIDKRLAINRQNMVRVDYAHGHHLHTNQKEYKEPHKSAVEKAIKERERETEGSLLSRAVHATLLGEFQLASVFMSTGYGQKNYVECLDYVLAHRSIQGGIPVSAIRGSQKNFRYLQQHNPQAFLTPFNHAKSLHTEAPEDVCDQPLLTICQLQTAGLIRTTDAANVLLPLLYVIEERMRKVLEKETKSKQSDADSSSPPSVKALLICSSEWNDFTLLLRSKNQNEATRCIESIVSVTLVDLMQRWELLAEEAKDCPEMRDPVELQYKKFGERFSRLLRWLSSGEEGIPSDAKTKNHFFSVSTSNPGILWPFAHHAIMALREQLEHGYRKAGPTRAAFEQWAVEGIVRGRVYLANQAGRDAEMSRDIREILRELAGLEFIGAQPVSRKWWRSAQRAPQGLLAKLKGIHPAKRLSAQVDSGKEKDFQETWWLLGYYDKVVPGTFLAPHPDTCLHNLKDLIARTYYLRWKLLKFKDVKQIWSGPEREGELTSLRDSSALRSLRVEIQSKVKHDGFIKKNIYVFHTTSHLQRFCENAFGVGYSATPRHENIMAFKRRRLSRHLRAAYLQVSARLQHALSDPQESVQALELADAYITWLNAILSALTNPSITTHKLENLTRAFTRPFGKALNQRAIVGFHMTEHTDFTTDLAGGANKNLTALDGLMKGVMALIGPPFRVGGLTVVGHEPSAEIRISTVQEEGRTDAQGSEAEYIYAVCTLNNVHLVHPMTISIVMHEMLHTILVSKGFKNALSSCGPLGDALAESHARSLHDEAEDFEKARFTEVLVEYLLGWLVFLPLEQGDPCLYAQTFLMHLALNIESYGNSEREGRLIVSEHILRCFLVDQLLHAELEGRDTCIDNSSVASTFSAWWQEKAAFIVAADSKLAKKYEFVLLKLLAHLLENDSIEARLSVIRKAVNRYFYATDDSYVDSKRSKACRRQFVDSLREAQKAHTGKIREKLSKCPPEPVNFVLEDGQELPENLSLRVRRLEGLVSNLVLIRGFYRVLCELLAPREGESLHLERKDGSIDFSKNGERDLMLDTTCGALFSVGREAHMRNIQLRQAFFLSMWHIAEIMKLPGVVNLHKLAKELDAAGERLFVFNKPFDPDKYDFLR